MNFNAPRLSSIVCTERKQKELLRGCTEAEMQIEPSVTEKNGTQGVIIRKVIRKG